jgi:uncharacterized membrane protein YeiH
MELSHPAFAWLAYLGVAVFAATGAIVAARKPHDVVTFAFFAATTGIGGGTVRDVLLDAPVFWIDDPVHLFICVAVGGAFWVIGPARWDAMVLDWLDAIGLAAFAILGAAKALDLGVSPLVCVVMGMFTATAGGIIRDVVAGEPSIMVRREIYVTAALVAASAYIVLNPLLGSVFAAAAGFVLGFALRGAALIFGWALPAFSGGLRGRK